MAVEQARIRLVPKPWGRTDLRPWNVYHDAGAAMGELWFERTDAKAPCPALLLKLIFTSAPLSIQVHPNDAFARSIGLAHGKCEAWYVLSASTDAEIAVGLKHRMTPAQLRTSIGDGSITEQVQWHAVRAGDTALVPPGTIHAIGAGLVIVEIQQRSDATFRLFDYGRGRELHVDAAVAAASADRAEWQPPLHKLTAARTLLVASPRFVLERLALPPESGWQLNATGETWLFILTGRARAGAIDVQTGNAVFLEADGARIEVGPDGLEGLVAYAGAAFAPDLLRGLNGMHALDRAQDRERTHFRAKAMSVIRSRLGGGGTLSPLGRLAFVGNSLPRRCGIATFTTDLQQAMEQLRPHEPSCIVAMTDPGQTYDYPPVVRLQINDRNLEEYEHAAHALNMARCEMVSLQHEFGIFGGEAGGHILALTSRLAMPLVTTLHTVLSQPTSAQRRVLEEIVNTSSRVIVMAEKGRELLRSVYRVPAAKIEVIPHGTPDCAFVEPDEAKAALGFGGRPVILTFGLLSPSKGIEVMIDAMPEILRTSAAAVYVVLGATHPNLIRDQGEAYRDGLMRRVRALGIEDHVVFLDRFVDQATLLRFITMCDVYATPYLNEAQMTSGTLAYSFGLGKAVVSTPYWHARELLGEGRGILVPFGDAAALGRETAALLSDEPRRLAMRERAYADGRSMIWPRIAERYRTAFASARRSDRRQLAARQDAGGRPRDHRAPRAMPIGHLLSLCDDTGLLQHAVHSVPDRSHGYCTDDNARALLLACALGKAGESPLPDALTSRFAAFLQHAWNPDTRRFRNFMGFDRRWHSDPGSEDCHGRALWALGECAQSDRDQSRRQWAASLFAEALPAVERFRSPRAWSFTLLGLDTYCAAVAQDADARRLRGLLADKLIAILAAVETQDWAWFEEGLAYDNARLPQALIVTGCSTGTPYYLSAGLRSLHWLMSLQTTPAGLFRPVGSRSFGAVKRTRPLPFDQQPLEVTASISACLAAWRAGGDVTWQTHAERAFAWFFGGNDLSLPLIDPETGGCRDGLHPDRPNENRGGESTVSYLLSLAEMRQLGCLTGEHPKYPLQLAAGA